MDDKPQMQKIFTTVNVVMTIETLREIMDRLRSLEESAGEIPKEVLVRFQGLENHKLVFGAMANKHDEEISALKKEVQKLQAFIFDIKHRPARKPARKPKRK